MTRIVCLSDTHGREFKVPEGDVVIHAGDATMTGTVAQVARFANWYGGLPHKHKVFVAGNHDWLFQRDPVLARQLMEDHGILYLQDRWADVPGVGLVYGSPWQPEFYDWAFNLPRGEALARKWAEIPDETRVLVTHGPPHGIRDVTKRGELVGCRNLRERIKTLPELRLHVFGHIHRDAGQLADGAVRYVNASICDESYDATNEPIVVDL